MKTIGQLRSEFAEWWSSEPYRKEAEAALSRYRGGNVVDVGAFKGFYSFLLGPEAKNGATLISIEPDIRFFSELTENLESLNVALPRLKFVGYNLIAGNGGKIQASCPNIGPEGQYGHPRFIAEPDTEHGLTSNKSIKVDDFYFAGLVDDKTLIKIDTEGAEFHVLMGMINLLQRSKPVICLELHRDFQPDGIETDRIIDIFSKNNFKKVLSIDRGNIEYMIMEKP